MHDDIAGKPSLQEVHRNFYGRLKGKHLKPSQQRYINEDLADLAICGVSRLENTSRQLLDPAKLFGNRPLWLEIGFGGGEHMVHQARTHSQVGFIGCEPYINGVAMLLGKIRETNVKNIRIHPGDVRDLFDLLPDSVFERVFLLYPDPWPKTRHHRRRFVTPGHLAPLARVMKPNAALHIATDIPDYVRQTLEQVPKHGFNWSANGPDDWRRPWDGWISTRYEKKALREGRRPHYLRFTRKL